MTDLSHNPNRSIWQSLRSAIRAPLRIASSLYLYLLGRPSAQHINAKILHLALTAHGYYNFTNWKISGEENFIKRFAQLQPKLCLDIGANKGQYSKLLLEYTQASIIAFEPLPKAFQILTQLANRYGDRYRPINIGIGSQNSTLDLYFGNTDSELATFSADVQQINFLGQSNIHSIPVTVSTLDEFISRNLKDLPEEIDLIKIDTEGFENDVLIGAKNTIQTYRPKCIQVEMNIHQLIRLHPLRLLAGLLDNYKVFQLLPYGTGMIRRDPDMPESNIFAFSNFVFVRRDIDIFD